jgi:hypothetical protein
VARPVSDVPLVHVGDGTNELEDHHAGLRFIRPSQRERKERARQGTFSSLNRPRATTRSKRSPPSDSEKEGRGGGHRRRVEGGEGGTKDL